MSSISIHKVVDFSINPIVSQNDGQENQFFTRRLVVTCSDGEVLALTMFAHEFNTLKLQS